MSSDGAGLDDDVQADLNPVDEPEPAEQPAAIERPADGAAKPKWVDYVVALGADRGSVTGEVRRFDAEQDKHVQPKALTREQLIELADSLGG